MQEDFERQKKEKEKDRKGPPVVKKDETKKKLDPESKVNERMKQSAKILERMVTQNIFNDISQGRLKINNSNEILISIWFLLL